MSEETSIVKYVCHSWDLDKLLDSDLKEKFQGLFPDPNASDDKSAWRMYYEGSTPQTFLSRFGIDYDNPRVRDAVAFDLVKLDDDSVSNDSEYTYMEHIGYSPAEYDRFLLNRNFRVNLVNLEKEWSRITYRKGEETEKVVKMKRTVDRMYQGIKMSDTILSCFDSVFDKGSADGVYVPFTNEQDFFAEVSLVPNTRKDFPAITSRAYYDTEHLRYLKRLENHGINAISTFALVDPDKDKNHTGEYLVKVQKISGSSYKYVVARMDKDGQFMRKEDGTLDVEYSESENNTILCVCENDFKYGRTPSSEIWVPQIDDIPMVKSTTSSHYSIFRQRIPEYDLKQVRHYFQFKNRLAGMELCLEQLNRDINRKEVRISEAFAKQSVAIQDLFKEIVDNKELLELVIKYYDYRKQYDDIYLKKLQLNSLVQTKTNELKELQDEYAALTNSQMDKKLSLGQKIQSMKLELNKSLKMSIQSIDDKLDEIKQAVHEINEQIERLQDPTSRYEYSRAAFDEFKEMLGGTAMAKAKTEFEEAMGKAFPSPRGLESSSVSEPSQGKGTDIQLRDVGTDGTEELGNMEFPEFHRKVLLTERWNGYILNLGYELNQLREMQVKCEDATIKVRRLVHNFKEKMERVESEIWDERHELKKDFSFTGISTAGLHEIILMHDWYATNAPEKSAEEMGFENDDDFMEFRKRCNTIAYNLRKNQYAKMLHQIRDRLQKRIAELESIIRDRKTLHYDDKYGRDGKKDEEKPWSIDDVTPEQERRIRLITQAEHLIHDVVRGQLMSARNLPQRKKQLAEDYIKAQRKLEQVSRDPIEAPDRKTRDDINVFSKEQSKLEQQERSEIEAPERVVRDDIKVFAEAQKTLESEERPDIVAPERNAREDIKTFAEAQYELEQQERSPIEVPFSKPREDIEVYAETQALLEQRYRDEAQYRKDAEQMVDKTLQYLKELGVIDKDEDIDDLLMKNRSVNFGGDVMAELDIVQESKDKLDKSIQILQKQRDSLQQILELVDGSEKRIMRLQTENRRLFNSCIAEKNKQVKNRILLQKMENETKVLELKAIVKKARKEHLTDFSDLERMKKAVDDCQSAHNEVVKSFREKIGMNQESLDRLMVGIYNKWQGEILFRGEE